MIITITRTSWDDEIRNEQVMENTMENIIELNTKKNEKYLDDSKEMTFMALANNREGVASIHFKTLVNTRKNTGGLDIRKERKRSAKNNIKHA